MEDNKRLWYKPKRNSGYEVIDDESSCNAWVN